MATFKLVDDVTLTELIDQSNIIRMRLAVGQIADWSPQTFHEHQYKEDQGNAIWSHY